MNRKAVSLSIKTVLILMIGALVVLTIMGAWSGFEQDTESSLEDSTDSAGEQSNDAACALECRQDHLGGGGEYEACVQSCS